MKKQLVRNIVLLLAAILLGVGLYACGGGGGGSSTTPVSSGATLFGNGQ